MSATEAFTKFVNRVLVPEKSRRYGELVLKDKGRRKILDELCHVFKHAIKAQVIRKGNYSTFLELPCFAYESRLGFGAEYQRVREALDSLSLADGWLIIVANASAGIHRPEGRWDEEMLIL